MFGSDSAMKEKLLEKILELFSGLPDKEDAVPAEGKAQVIAIDAEPVEKKEKAIC